MTTRRIPTPDGPVIVADTAPSWDDDPRLTPEQRCRSDRRITIALAVLPLALLAATIGRIIASHI